MAAPVSVRRRSLFVRRLTAYDDIEAFLVVAVTTMLLVRAALAATGWPQLGGGKIHFAHLLWGGLGMLVALILFMAMQGRLWRQLATFVAGVGFGLFIDELGKFITSDNDYFFEPAIAIIYVVFVVLMLVARALTHERAISPQMALVSAFDLAKEATMRDLDESERREALALLARCDQDDPVVRDLTATLEHVTVSQNRGNPYLWLKGALGRLYGRLVAWRWFKVTVIGWYVIVALMGFAYPFVAGMRPGHLDLAKAGELDFAEVGQLVSAFASGVLVLVAVLSWRRSRLAAYRWLERAILVTIFINEFFAFYEKQLTAVFGLFVVLVTYATIRLMVAEETRQAAPGLPTAVE